MFNTYWKVLFQTIFQLGFSASLKELNIRIAHIYIHLEEHNAVKNKRYSWLNHGLKIKANKNTHYSWFCSCLITSCANEGAQSSLQSCSAGCLILWHSKNDQYLFNKALLPFFELFKWYTVTTKEKCAYAHCSFATKKCDSMIDCYILLYFQSCRFILKKKGLR